MDRDGPREDLRTRDGQRSAAEDADGSGDLLGGPQELVVVEGHRDSGAPTLGTALLFGTGGVGGIPRTLEALPGIPAATPLKDRFDALGILDGGSDPGACVGAGVGAERLEGVDGASEATALVGENELCRLDLAEAQAGEAPQQLRWRGCWVINLRGDVATAVDPHVSPSCLGRSLPGCPSSPMEAGNRRVV